MIQTEVACPLQRSFASAIFVHLIGLAKVRRLGNKTRTRRWTALIPFKDAGVAQG